MTQPISPVNHREGNNPLAPAAAGIGCPPRQRARGAPLDTRRLRRLRIEAGLTMDELAKRAEVTPAFISQIERSVRGVSPITLRKIAGVLGCKIADLLTEENGSAA